MNKTKEDLLLHPVRARMIATIAGRQVTAQQLADELPDIPQASLYRHLNTLTAAGLLNVVRERRVHNTIEKTYALPEEGLMLTAEDMEGASREDYLRLATRYFGVILGYYTRYIQKGDADLARDNVLFQLAPLYLSPGEIAQLGQALRTTLLPFLKNEPSPERRRTLLGLIFFPDVVAALEPASSQTGTTLGKSATHGEE